MEHHYEILFFAMCVAIVVARMLRAVFKFLQRFITGCLWLFILALLAISIATVTCQVEI